VLPGAGAQGSTITWSAEPESYINLTTGAVTRPTEENITVTLTARIIYPGGTEQTKEFTLHITRESIPGAVTGTVRDSSGNPILGAEVRLTVSGSEYSAVTIADGSYNIPGVPAGEGYTVTAGKPGYTAASVTDVSVTADTTTLGVDITLTSDEDGCLVTYKGAQVRYNEGSKTYDIRFIAVIDHLNAKEVGFVFSKIQEIPTRENASEKATSTVYTEITAEGSTVTAQSLGGMYIIACTITGIPEDDISIPLHVRAFSTVGTVTKYTPVTTVTVSGLLD
jgi:hypothetical protein